MSYMNPLRLHFAGQFQANVSTVNNDPGHFYNAVFRPEEPLAFKVAAPAAKADTLTIGEFYQEISNDIGVLGDSVFVNPPRNQVGPELMPGAVVVHDVATAQQAIQVIIEQGEGTSTSPSEVVGGGVAHYYRFMQIKEGRALIPNPRGKTAKNAYTYGGRPIPFDPGGCSRCRSILRVRGTPPAPPAPP